MYQHVLRHCGYCPVEIPGHGDPHPDIPWGDIIEVYQRSEQKMVLRSLVFLNLFAIAASVRGDQLEFSSAWARAPAPGAKSMAIYGVLNNRSSSSWVVSGFESDVAVRIMLHESMLKDGIMSMSAVGEVEIAAGKSVVLEPGGLHLMVMGMSVSPEEGDVLDLKVLSAGGEVISAKVVIGSVAQMTMPH